MFHVVNRRGVEIVFCAGIRDARLFLCIVARVLGATDPTISIACAALCVGHFFCFDVCFSMAFIPSLM